MAVEIDGARVLVTGAARGLGRVFTRALLARGARTVYAGARDESRVTEPGVVPVRLDITSAEEVAAAAVTCADVNIVINNASVMHTTPALAAPDLAGAHAEMDTNYFGTLAMCRAFAPILGANGGGALVNMLSIVAWFANPFNSTYCASKSAAWSMTNAARTELRHQGTLVTGVFAGLIDTEMAAAVNLPKISPESVAEQTLDAIEAGAEEVLADERTRTLKANLPDDLTAIYPGVQKMWDSGHWG
jgi:NAD(P)-dependent dehydrogenase (short-subunit alcohol dehydrogenase family)